MDRVQQIADAWHAAFNRIVGVTHDSPEAGEEIFSVDGVVIASEPGGWVVGAEIITGGNRWEDASYHFHEDSIHPTFDAALARAVEVMREDEERRCRELERVADDVTPF
jgi:hypothetical protein